MSDVPQQESAGDRLRGRWQIPLLVVSLGLLVAGIWRMRPEPTLPTFEQLYDCAVALKQAELYPEASEYIQNLLNPPDPAAETNIELQPDETQKLHQLMAEVIYAHELGNVVHDPTNVARIIEHFDLAGAVGEAADAKTHLARAKAREWQERASQAIDEYSQALAAGVENPWDIRKRIIEIRRSMGTATTEWLYSEFDAFVAGEDIGDELRFWAAEQKLMLLVDNGQHAEAESYLAANAERFKKSVRHGDYEYLQAWIWFANGRLDDAERLLRTLRDELVPGYPLYARTGWLLGKIMQTHPAPQPALSFFDDVISKTTPSEYRTLSVLGRAETLAALERFDESTAAYKEVLRLVSETPYNAQVDLQRVRQSTTALYEALRISGRLPEALGYLRIAIPLVPASNDRMQAVYAERLADLTFALGQSTQTRADTEDGEEAEQDRQQTRQYFLESAEAYLKQAKLATLDEQASSTAMWRAADAMDLAGERERRAEVLEAFVRQRPENARVPEALMCLGETYQAIGDYEKAIGAYQRCLIEHPRTFWSGRTLVLLAECFISKGQMGKGEQTLLRIVDRLSDDSVAPVLPAATEYRDALFRLGDLYIRSTEYEKAIARYEEAIQRYPSDPRAYRAAFLLADAYRRSAIRIRDDMADPKNIARKDELKVEHQKRLARAQELFSDVIERYRLRANGARNALDEQYVRLSYFYRADAVYDRSYMLDPSDVRPYVEALQKYDEAAWLYQNDPIAMSAYVQMINCHLRMGNVSEAKRTLQRAGWALRNITDERFETSLIEGGRAFWEDYLSWLAKTPTFEAAGDVDS